MNQNTSSAVMQQRTEPDDSLDDFPTPPWGTRALCEYLKFDGSLTCREPAANRGHMVKSLKEYFKEVIASDIFDYGAGFPVSDYLFPDSIVTDWTITNPPFRLAEQFIHLAMDQSRFGVAVIVRTAFLESIGRYENLFSRVRPSHVLQFVERVVMHKGKLSEKGSTATAYCWIVWQNKKTERTEFDWIAPCRKRLERAGDY